MPIGWDKSDGSDTQVTATMRTGHFTQIWWMPKPEDEQLIAAYCARMENKALAERDEAERDQVRMDMPAARVEKLIERFHQLKGY